MARFRPKQTPRKSARRTSRMVGMRGGYRIRSPVGAVPASAWMATSRSDLTGRPSGALERHDEFHSDDPSPGRNQSTRRRAGDVAAPLRLSRSRAADGAHARRQRAPPHHSRAVGGRRAHPGLAHAAGPARPRRGVPVVGTPTGGPAPPAGADRPPDERAVGLPGLALAAVRLLEDRRRHRRRAGEAAAGQRRHPRPPGRRRHLRSRQPEAARSSPTPRS